MTIDHSVSMKEIDEFFKTRLRDLDDAINKARDNGPRSEFLALCEAKFNIALLLNDLIDFFINREIG